MHEVKPFFFLIDHSTAHASSNSKKKSHDCEPKCQGIKHSLPAVTESRNQKKVIRACAFKLNAHMSITSNGIVA